MNTAVQVQRGHAQLKQSHKSFSVGESFPTCWDKTTVVWVQRGNVMSWQHNCLGAGRSSSVQATTLMFKCSEFQLFQNYNTAVPVWQGCSTSKLQHSCTTAVRSRHVKALPETFKCMEVMSHQNKILAIQLQESQVLSVLYSSLSTGMSCSVHTTLVSAANWEKRKLETPMLMSLIVMSSKTINTAIHVQKGNVISQHQHRSSSAERSCHVRALAQLFKCWKVMLCQCISTAIQLQKRHAIARHQHSC